MSSEKKKKKKKKECLSPHSDRWYGLDSQAENNVQHVRGKSEGYHKFRILCPVF